VNLVREKEAEKKMFLFTRTIKNMDTVDIKLGTQCLKIKLKSSLSSEP
jgi:hypothetical protein